MGVQDNIKKTVKTSCHHYEDFGIVAEWHFFATSHGKGPPDGVGGTVEREAATASLQQVQWPHYNSCSHFVSLK